MSSINTLDVLSALIKIESVRTEGKEGAPYGEGCKKALDFFLQTGKDMGFSVFNADSHAGHLEYGEGDITVGVLAHLDVVPAGSGWNTNPFEAVVKDGKLYGRGAMDDKGPAVAALFALKAYKDELERAGKKPKARVRLIVGTNEENGSSCISHYKTRQQMPDIAFSPDADFPVINCEKTLYGARLVFKRTPQLDAVVASMSGGKAHNAVPDCAECVLSDGRTVSASGISAHSMECEKGKNAIVELARTLLQDPRLKDEPVLSLIASSFDPYGKRLGVDFSDEESGDTRLNLVGVSTDSDTISLLIDMRVAVTYSVEDIERALTKALPRGAAIERTNFTPHLYVPADSFLVTTLLDVYSKAFGVENPKPIVTGGGTYARTMENCVAFGATLPGAHHNIHSSDEYIEIELIDRLVQVFKAAIERLSDYKK